MKHSKHNTARRIAVAILTFAIAMTGVSFDATIANAAVIDGRFENNSSITLTSIDETKALNMIVTDDFGYEINMTHHYEWTSSDESIVSAKMIQPDRIMRENDYIMITAHTNGTAPITGTLKPESFNVTENASKTVTMTVTVNAPVPAASTETPAKKMTAKQRKCKHVYKVTRKATCERTGLKTCKKCKWQVSIKAKHTWSTETWYDIENTKEYYVVYCTGRDCALEGLTRLECSQKYGSGNCPHACTWESGRCETYEEAFQKWQNHPTKTIHGACGDRWEYGDPQRVKVTVKTCTKCGEETVTRTPAE